MERVIKVRKVDYSFDEFLAAVAGMRADDIGVYWIICSLIYSSGGPIKIDDPRIFAIIKTRNTQILGSIERLVAVSKLSRSGNELDSKRCRSELERVSKRIRSWSENGRVLKKNNALKKQGLPTRARHAELLTTNYQLSDSNESDSLKKNDTFVSQKKGTRLADDFAMPAEWVEDGRTARAKAQLPPADLAVEILKFSNYWQTKSGQQATKRDWRKTWINWCLNAKGTPNGYDPSGAKPVSQPRVPQRPLTPDEERRIFNLD